MYAKIIARNKHSGAWLVPSQVLYFFGRGLKSEALQKYFLNGNLSKTEVFDKYLLAGNEICPLRPVEQ
jgi:hypothetical protein